MIVVLAAAADAWFLRHQIDCDAPCTKVAAHDARTRFRTFTDFYFTRLGLVAALAGFVLVIRRGFWRDPALVLTVTGFALAFFYKIRIAPTQFWLNRRYMPIVLPGMLLFAAAAALGPATKPWRGFAMARATAGALLLGALGWQYAAAAAPILPHVEYTGIIDDLEQLSSMFTNRDLVIVESRDAGTDIQVLAAPLAYVYERQVLLMDGARPDKAMLRAFLEHASGLYAHVYFVGGGTDLLSRHIRARPITNRKFVVPQADDDVPWNVYPRNVQNKALDFGVYELSIGQSDAAGGFAHDIGTEDDLYVLRFYARDFNGAANRCAGLTGTSIIAVPGLAGKETERSPPRDARRRPPEESRRRASRSSSTACLSAPSTSRGLTSRHIDCPCRPTLRGRPDQQMTPRRSGCDRRRGIRKSCGGCRTPATWGSC